MSLEITDREYVKAWEAYSLDMFNESYDVDTDTGTVKGKQVRWCSDEYEKKLKARIKLVNRIGNGISSLLLITCLAYFVFWGITPVATASVSYALAGKVFKRVIIGEIVALLIYGIIHISLQDQFFEQEVLAVQYYWKNGPILNKKNGIYWIAMTPDIDTCIDFRNENEYLKFNNERVANRVLEAMKKNFFSLKAAEPNFLKRVIRAYFCNEQTSDRDDYPRRIKQGIMLEEA